MYVCFCIFCAIQLCPKRTCFNKEALGSVQDTRRTMDLSSFINVLLLCVVNVIFMIAGIFLNSVVIISLRRSSQLRKNLGYFMILVLSCFDLAVVTFSHPGLIASTILWSMETYQEKNKFIILANVMGQNLAGFSLSALLTMSVERYLALKYPFFHHTAVTKRRLVLFLAIFIIVIVSLSPWLYFHCRETFGNAIIIFFHFVIFVAVYLLELQHLHHRQVKTQSRKKGNICSERKEKAKIKFSKYFHMFDGGWLFFYLLFSIYLILCFAFHE